MQHDHSLSADLQTLARQIQRRQMVGWLGWLGSAGGAGLLGACGGGGSEAAAATPAPSPAPAPAPAPASCSLVPEETAGPYPGDGSNGPNALALAGILRSDMRASIAGATGVADGVPLTITLQLVNVAGSCASLADYAIYLWHCDRLGRYSLYSAGVTAENYLRAVQATGSDGKLSFTTIFPGCYDGRMPHMHFEVYRSSAQATNFANKIRTSQIAFPTAVCDAVYRNASGYASSLTNFGRISFASDNVFSDGTTLQMATVSGDGAGGYTASLTIGVNG